MTYYDEDLYLDIETFSEVNLQKAGVYRYAQHESARVSVACWAIGDEPVQEWSYGQVWPQELDEALWDPRRRKWAHNASFERVVLSSARAPLYVPSNPASWRCSMVQAATLMLPLGLDNLAVALKLPGKLAEGKDLLKLFAIPPGKPDYTHPRWPEFIEYCRVDVEVMRDAIKKMARYPVPESEWELYALDQEINDNGLPVDVAFVERAAKVSAEIKKRGLSVAKEITELENPNSVPQLMNWLLGNDAEISNLQKATVEAYIKSLPLEDANGKAPLALTARTQYSRVSLKKYDNLLGRVGEGDRYRGAFRFYKAHTGRWAGQDVQPHNLPKGSIGDPEELKVAREFASMGTEALTQWYADPGDTMSSLVRTAFAAPEGKKLVVGDYKSIEVVMVAWAAERGRLWDVLADGRDVYKDFASILFGVPYAKVNKVQRNLAKPAVLGCQYLLGADGFMAYAAQFGMALSKAEALRQVTLYRSTYPEIGRFWNGVRDATYEAVVNRTRSRYQGFTCWADKAYLFIELPSGRALAYYRPRIEQKMKPWKELGPTLTYQMPLRRVSTHPGKITENIIQGISRDVMGTGLQTTAGDDELEVVGHVHDEAITLADLDDEGATDRLEGHLSTRPWWCPDAPIEAECWEGPFYRKA